MLSALFICFIFMSIPNLCSSMLSIIYLFFYLTQAVQHYLINIFPKIDINKHHMAYRRIVIAICLVDMGYMLMCITFL
jgi:hypothetical protein